MCGNMSRKEVRRPRLKPRYARSRAVAMHGRAATMNSRVRYARRRATATAPASPPTAADARRAPLVTLAPAAPAPIALAPAPASEEGNSGSRLGYGGVLVPAGGIEGMERMESETDEGEPVAMMRDAVSSDAETGALGSEASSAREGEAE